MAGMARVEVIGNLGSDVKVGTTQGGSLKAEFSVAHSPRVQQGQPERTNWYRCVLFGKRAEALQTYLVKGKKVYVRGDIDIRDWTANDGAARYSIDVMVSEIELLGDRQESQQRPQAAAGGTDSDFFDQDVPF